MSGVEVCQFCHDAGASRCGCLDASRAPVSAGDLDALVAGLLKQADQFGFVLSDPPKHRELLRAAAAAIRAQQAERSVDDVDKADAWDAIAAKNARIASLEAELAALRASACKGEVKTGDGWQGIDSAPYDTPVRVKLGEGMSIVAVLRHDASEGEDGPCDQWQAHHEDEHPECWSGGACWGSNDNGVPSMQPTHWTPAALAAPGSAPRVMGVDMASGPDQTAVTLINPTQAALDVLAERQRQISAEGWTPAHDDQHDQGEMATAAATYAFNAFIGAGYRAFAADPMGFWPWDQEWFKPTHPYRDLEKAGALILAEMERLNRAALAAPEGEARG